MLPLFRNGTVEFADSRILCHILLQERVVYIL